MAKRYICRLYFIELPGGLTRISYEVSRAELIARPVDLIGPARIEVPDSPQTEAEHNAWLFRTILPNGPYTMSISARDVNLPPIEEQDIPDVDSMCVAVEIGTHQRAGQRSILLVAVRNIGGEPIPAMSVRWESENEVPQPANIGTIQVSDLGNAFDLIPDDSFSGSLAVGDRARFLLDERFLPPVLSCAASLSPGQYGISVRSGETEIHRVGGEEVGASLDELDGADA